MSLDPWPSATSILRPLAQRVSAPERCASPSPLADSLPPRWWPIAVWSIWKRSSRPSVCAKSRAVTSTSSPRRRRASITGRMTRTCGEFVRSIQTRKPCRLRTALDPRAAQSSVDAGLAGLTSSQRGTYAPERSGPAPMFPSQSLRAVPKPGSVGFKEHRLDDVVHQIDVQGALEETSELSRRIGAALESGVRWLILDLSEAVGIPDVVLAGLVEAAG